MNDQVKIPGTEEAWESGRLGADEKHVSQLSAEELAREAELIDDSLGLQPISIRLEKSLIDDFKSIATINGLAYQTLMRQALKRFADCEKKRILSQLAAEAAVKKAEKAAVKAEKVAVKATTEEKKQQKVPHKKAA